MIDVQSYDPTPYFWKELDSSLKCLQLQVEPLRAVAKGPLKRIHEGGPPLFAPPQDSSKHTKGTLTESEHLLATSSDPLHTAVVDMSSVVERSASETDLPQETLREIAVSLESDFYDHVIKAAHVLEQQDWLPEWLVCKTFEVIKSIWTGPKFSIFMRPFRVLMYVLRLLSRQSSLSESSIRYLIDRVQHLWNDAQNVAVGFSDQQMCLLSAIEVLGQQQSLSEGVTDQVFNLVMERSKSFQTSYMELSHEINLISAVQLLGTQKSLAAHIRQKLVGFVRSPSPFFQISVLNTLRNQKSMTEELQASILHALVKTDFSSKPFQRLSELDLKIRFRFRDVMTHGSHQVLTLETLDTEPKPVARAEERLSHRKNDSKIQSAINQYLHTEPWKKLKMFIPRGGTLSPLQLGMFVLEYQRRLPKPSVETLVNNLVDHSSLQQNSKALEMLSRQDELPHDAQKALVKYLGDPAHWDQVNIRLPPLDTLSRDLIGRVCELLQGPNERVQAVAIEILAQQELLSEELITKLVRPLHSPDFNKRVYALQALTKRDPIPKWALDAIIPLLNDPHDGIRFNTIKRLSLRKLSSKEILLHCIKTLFIEHTYEGSTYRESTNDNVINFLNCPYHVFSRDVVEKVIPLLWSPGKPTQNFASETIQNFSAQRVKGFDSLTELWKNDPQRVEKVCKVLRI